MKILVIPDIHLKPWIFDRASEIMGTGVADRAVCLMDIPDDRGSGQRLEQYAEAFDAAIRFQKQNPETLWCYGNHELAYIWRQPESGFMEAAITIVNEKLYELKRCLPDKKQMAYVHKIDNVLFVHGGLTRAFVKYYAPDLDYDDADAVAERINSLGAMEIWDDASPVWFRPQFYYEKMYRERDLLQVVGHTPVKRIDRVGSVLSCDLFSTYTSGAPVGTQEYVLIDTKTWEYRGIL